MLLSPEDLASRAEGIRLARVDALIEGLREHPDDAPVLDAYARGEIDADEVRRRVLARIRCKGTRQRTQAA